MTMQKPQLVPSVVESAPEESAPRPKSRPLRDAGVGVGSAVLGALLALAVGIVQDNRRLSPHAPAVGVTAVSVYTPEIATPDPNKPMPPALIDRQIVTLHDRLGVSDAEMSLSSEKAADLIAANVAAAATLDIIDSPLRYVRVDTWVADIAKAAKMVIGLYSEHALIEKMGMIFSDKSQSTEQAKAAFLNLLEHYPDHDGAFSDMATAYQLNSDNDTVKQIEAWLPKAGKSPVVWQFYPFPEGELKMLSYGFSIGKIGIMLRHGNNLGRQAANTRLAVLLSRFNRDELGKVATLATSLLLSEIRKLGAFLAASDKVIRSEVKPRISVESSAFNDSRAALTIAPRAVLRIVASSGTRFDVPLKLVSLDGAGAEPASSSDATSRAGTLKYATIESGKLGRILWAGEFGGSEGEWGTLAKAYESGTLNCELTVQTVDGMIARSPAAPFGGSAGSKDPATVKLADMKP